LAAGAPAPRIHEQAKRGFARAAEAYERGRPEYPEAAIHWLAEQLDLRPGLSALDVGAGTGKLTRALVPTGARFFAVEPVAEMRAVLRRQVPEAEVLAAGAEQVPLPDASLEAIVAGSAFHWFDGPRALEEFHRLLSPGGRLALIWNRRDKEQPLQRAIDALIEPHRGDTPSQRSDQWAAAFEETSRFVPVDDLQVAFEQPLDRRQFVDRVMSISFVSALPDQEGDRVQGALEELADRQLEPLRYSCQVFVYRRTD
jgi:ubiquinone/menaquinone biosynthesis C-methylase UbiE